MEVGLCLDLIARGEHEGSMRQRLGIGSEAELVQLAQQACPQHAVLIVCTARGHLDNWFSHWHHPARNAVISTFTWSFTADVDLEAFAAYETILYWLNEVVPGQDPLALTHEETRGCMFDLCRSKSDIEIKLQTMDICEDCRSGLAERGVDVRAVSHLCDVVRTLAASKAGA